MPVTVGGSTITMNSGSVIQEPPGSAPSYLCRAWVNWNGQGAVSIRASANVSSITDLGTGFYRLNFSTGMPDANYSVSMAMNSFGYYDGGVEMMRLMSAGSNWTGANNISTGSVDLFVGKNQGSFGADAAYLFAQIFR